MSSNKSDGLSKVHLVDFHDIADNKCATLYKEPFTREIPAAQCTSILPTVILF